MPLEGPHLLFKVLDGVDVNLSTPPAPGDFASIEGGNWQSLDVGLLTPTYANRSYYDLSGYDINDLTTFIQSVEIQEGYGIFGNAPCNIMDMISTEFIDNATLLAAYVYTTGDGDPPGFNLSPFNMEQIIYGRMRTFTTSNQWGDIAVQKVTNWGTGAATSGDKLYITRVVYPLAPGTPGQVVHIPPCAYVAGIVVAKEKDLSYIMRQKRSYELAQKIMGN